MTSVALITLAGGILIASLGLYSKRVERLDKEARRKKLSSLPASEK
jgi:hypothetical protein